MRECLSGQDCDACVHEHELFVVRLDAQSQSYLSEVRQEMRKCWSFQDSYPNSRSKRATSVFSSTILKTSSSQEIFDRDEAYEEGEEVKAGETFCHEATYPIGPTSQPSSRATTSPETPQEQTYFRFEPLPCTG